MKKTFYLTLILIITTMISSLKATLDIPSNGSNGDLLITTDTVIDLSQAVSGDWDDDNSANPSLGTYDAGKWAVVFHYSSVTIVEGATVTFTNHPTNAPVVWFVQGNVDIAGTLSLQGHAQIPGDGSIPIGPVDGGPGGFRGGAKGPEGNGSGMGPGGAQSSGGNGVNGKYKSVYGNPQLLPLIGGSGGGGSKYHGTGGGGGGAILIATPGVITVDGLITADGGDYGETPDLEWGAGSGGGIRIIADEVQGSGIISARKDGIIRIEKSVEGSVSDTLQISPGLIAVDLSGIPVIWPPSNAPSVRIVSVDGVNAPLDPIAPLHGGADVVIQNNNVVSIILETTDFPIEGTVEVRINYKYGNYIDWLNASYVSGDINSAIWQLSTTLSDGFCTLQARATLN